MESELDFKLIFSWENFIFVINFVIVIGFNVKIIISVIQDIRELSVVVEVFYLFVLNGVSI